jgi:hypothetical protein
MPHLGSLSGSFLKRQAVLSSWKKNRLHARELEQGRWQPLEPVEVVAVALAAALAVAVAEAVVEAAALTGQAGRVQPVS